MLIDTNLSITNLGEIIVEKLKELFDETGSIKVCAKQLTIPYSIQWIIPKRNTDGERVSTRLRLWVKGH